MNYAGKYQGTLHTYCAEFDYTDPITFTIDESGYIDLPYSSQGTLNDGKIDADGNISGISITVTSMSLGRLTINYIARDDGKDFYGSGTSINGITSTIQATLISTPTTTPSITPSFSAADLKLQNFGTTASAGGWTSDNQYRRTMADVNGDGRADIVASASRALTWLSPTARAASATRSSSCRISGRPRGRAAGRARIGTTVPWPT